MSNKLSELDKAIYSLSSIGIEVKGVLFSDVFTIGDSTITFTTKQIIALANELISM